MGQARLISVHHQELRVEHDDGTPETSHSVLFTATVTLNGNRAKLSDLRIGDRLTMGGEPVSELHAVREGFPIANAPDSNPPGESQPANGGSSGDAGTGQDTARRIAEPKTEKDKPDPHPPSEFGPAVEAPESQHTASTDEPKKSEAHKADQIGRTHHHQGKKKGK